MIGLYSSLSTSGRVRYVRRVAWMLFGVVLLVVAATTWLSTSEDTSATLLPTIIAFSLVGALLLAPLGLIALRRGNRIAKLKRRRATTAVVAAYMLPELRQFIDDYGLRSSRDLDESAILVASNDGIELWGGGGVFDVLAVIPFASCRSIGEASYDGYRCVQVSLVGSVANDLDLDLVLCGVGFGVATRRVRHVVDVFSAALAQYELKSRPERGGETFGKMT